MTETGPGRPGQLEGRTVLVTGGNGGIGLGIAKACGLAGAHIAIWGRKEAKNTAALEELRGLGITADAFVSDVDDQDAIRATFAETLDTCGGRIDSLFANAGTTGNPMPFVDVPFSEWRRVLTTNLDGVFGQLQCGARHMVERGEGGSLVVVSSTAAIHGALRNHAYGASKGALLSLMRALAVELAPKGIRVNGLLPGWTVTELSGPGYESDKFREVIINHTPVRRWADPDEMGAAGVFLADPTTTFHTGDSIVVDGGYTKI